MSSYPRYIVLAHLPKDQKDPIFQGEFRLHPTEWQIFDGALGERQARAQVTKYEKYFINVQLRTVGVQVK
jgi:hypothetical protein